MSKLKRELKLMLAVGLLAVNTPLRAETPNYNGLSTDGFVEIKDVGGVIQMCGTPNVRFDPGYRHEKSYIYASYRWSQLVQFGGHDANRNRSFYCYVHPNTSGWQQAVDIANNLDDGRQLCVKKESETSNLCMSIYVESLSKRLH